LKQFLNANHLLGKIARWPLQMLPKGQPVPFMQNSLRGMKWILGSGPHSCWLGFAEQKKRKLFEKSIRKDGIVLDIGANVGYYTLMAARGVGAGGRVIAFEPSPRNFSFLRKHLEINNIRNAECQQLALSNEVGTARFAADIDPVAQRMTSSGNISVKTTTIDEFLAGANIKVDLIKIDVEGAELKVLQGARNTLQKMRPKVFIETHDRFESGVHQQCEKFLLELGYRVENIEENEIYGF
jgi:FkbM family methyltransferase